MRCGLDVTCHLWAWFWALPWWVHWGLLVCLVLALWGVAARLWSIAKAFGGWQAATAAVGALALILAAVFLRTKPRPAEPEPDDPDFAPPPPRPRPTIRAPRHRETVSDWFKRVTGQ